MCLCDYGYEDTSMQNCNEEGNDFQWYLMYSLFGACVLFFSFLARRLHTCCRRRAPGGELAHPLHRGGRTGIGGGVETWTDDQLTELVVATVKVKAVSECAICFDQSTSLLLQPCTHMLCDTCAKKIFGINLECPFCRAEVEGAHRVVEDPVHGEDLDRVSSGCILSLKEENRSSEDEVSSPSVVVSTATEVTREGYTRLSEEGSDNRQLAESSEDDEGQPLTRTR